MGVERLTDSVEEQVRACLREIKDPCSVATGHPLHLEEMGLVKEIRASGDGGQVHVDLRLTSPTCMMVGFFVTEIEKLVHSRVDPNLEVEVSFDRGFEWTPEMMSRPVRNARAARFAPQG